MSSGELFRNAAKVMMDRFGGNVIVHRNYGQPDLEISKHVGKKNAESDGQKRVYFQFLDRFEISLGDVLQQEGAADQWRVIECEDKINGNTYVYFMVFVEKIGSSSRQLSGSIVVNGPNYGPIQMSTNRSTQIVSSNFDSLSPALSSLRKLLEDPKIDEIDREEAEAAIDRVEKLAKKEKSEKVTELVKEKLDIVMKVLAVATGLAGVASPYIEQVRNWFN